MQVPIIVAIRENATGEIVTLHEDCNTKEDGTPDPFWWSRHTGNAGCDCNRMLFFWRARGVERIHEDDACGDTAYDVNLATPDGSVFYREFAE
jgi:hypothetical protein